MLRNQVLWRCGFLIGLLLVARAAEGGGACNAEQAAVVPAPAQPSAQRLTPVPRAFLGIGVVQADEADALASGARANPAEASPAVPNVRCARQALRSYRGLKGARPNGDLFQALLLWVLTHQER